MADDAARRAPERTGQLAYSISVSEGRTRRAKTSFRRIHGVQMAMGPASGFAGVLNYASFDEFGTVDTPAFGFMRGAWDAGKFSALDYVQDNLWREVKRATDRFARKTARAG